MGSCSTCIAACHAQMLYYTDAQTVCREIERSRPALGIRSMHVWTLNQGESVCPLILLVFYCLFAYLANFAHTTLLAEEVADKPTVAYFDGVCS